MLERAQFNLIRLLAGGHGNLCVVGDDDQSIYKFRGADINNILDFEKYFNDAKIIKLEQNYRSTQKILDVANEVIKNNAGRKDKRLWTSVKDGTKVIFNVYENGYEEARGIAEDIAHRHLHDRKDYSDFAILYRTNAQSRSLEEKLIEKNIPYRIYGGINFYARREIKDILAYLKTIDNARDDLAVKRILNVPKRGIGAASVAKVDDYAYENDITFYVALRQAKEVPGLQRAVSKVEGFVTQIEVLKSKSQYIGVGKLIEEIIETVGYSDYIDAESESDEQATERRQNIDELISKAVQYEETVLSYHRMLPTIVYHIPGILPLVPGAAVYRCITSAMESRVLETTANILTALKLAGAIGIGSVIILVLPQAWFSFFPRLKRKNS